MNTQIELDKVRYGEHFVFDGVEFIKLDDDHGTSFVLTADTLPGYYTFEEEDSSRYEHNNFTGSLIQKTITRWLHEDHPALSKAVIERPIDLTCMDGMTDFGTPFTFARILTSDEYRKYRRFIPLTKKPYWLATPWCTLSSSYFGDSRGVCYVSTDGVLRITRVFVASYCCARPAIYLESSLLVSVETDCAEKTIRNYTDAELIDELYRRKNKMPELLS